MQTVYRDVAKVVNHRIDLLLPDNIDSDKVEVIIIPFINSEEKKPKVDFRKYFGVSNLDISLIDNYLEKIRNEWERPLPY